MVEEPISEKEPGSAVIEREDFTFVVDPDAAVIRFKPGDFTGLAKVDRAYSAIKGLLGEHDFPLLIMDFSDVRIVSSQGLCILVAVKKQLESMGRDLRLCGMNDMIRRIFEDCRLNTIIPVHASVEEARRPETPPS